jgi:GNAT superfamily N-acetyltransferase
VTARFSIKVASIEDAQRISELLAVSYPVLMRDDYDDEALAWALPFMTKANPTLLRSGTYYLAETAEGRAVACGGWTMERPGSGERITGLGHIRHFATHPDWTGLGIATAVFERCKEDALSARLTAFECNASLNAVSFYASLGFVAVEEISVPMGPDVQFPAVLMRLPL